MKKVFDKLCECVPVLWGILWIITITIASIGAFIWASNWVVNLIRG